MVCRLKAGPFELQSTGFLTIIRQTDRRRRRCGCQTRTPPDQHLSLRPNPRLSQRLSLQLPRLSLRLSPHLSPRPNPHLSLRLSPRPRRLQLQHRLLDSVQDPHPRPRRRLLQHLLPLLSQLPLRGQLRLRLLSQRRLLRRRPHHVPGLRARRGLDQPRHRLPRLHQLLNPRLSQHPSRRRLLCRRPHRHPPQRRRPQRRLPPLPLSRKSQYPLSSQCNNPSYATWSSLLSP